MSFPFPGNSTLGSVRIEPTRTVIIPNGAKKIKSHNPIVVENNSWLNLSDIKLKEIPQSITGNQYVADNSKDKFCDAAILDELVKAATSGLRGLSHAQHKLSVLGNERIIFFFGTIFIAENGMDAVVFLNLSSNMVGLRYITYLSGQMKFLTVPSFAATL